MWSFFLGRLHFSATLFRRWIWAFEFSSWAARPAGLTEPIPALIRFDSQPYFVLLCDYTGKEVVG